MTQVGIQMLRIVRNAGETGIARRNLAKALDLDVMVVAKLVDDAINAGQLIRIGNGGGTKYLITDIGERLLAKLDAEEAEQATPAGHLVPSKRREQSKPAKKQSSSGPKWKKSPRPCLCGCGGFTNGGIFMMGHDAKLKSLMQAVLRGEEPESAITPEAWTYIRENRWEERFGPGKKAEVKVKAPNLGDRIVEALKELLNPEEPAFSDVEAPELALKLNESLLAVSGALSGLKKRGLIETNEVWVGGKRHSTIHLTELGWQS